MLIEAKLEDLGLALPEPMRVPAGLRMPFSWVRVRANRAYVSGHIALNPDGSVAEPLGKVGAEVSAEESYESARRVDLAHLASLKRALGDLDRVTACCGSSPWSTRFPASTGRRWSPTATRSSSSSSTAPK